MYLAENVHEYLNMGDGETEEVTVCFLDVNRWKISRERRVQWSAEINELPKE
jgi:hypothetical protein